MSIKDDWIQDRTKKIVEDLNSTQIVALAEDNGVKFADQTTREEIARRIAIHEWKGRSSDSLEVPDYPPADVVAYGDEFNAFESGPMEAIGPQPQTSSGFFIYEVLLPEFLERFFAKNADYGDQHRRGLGVAAEYVGIHRKIEKLKAALWDGQEMNGEDAREMLMDLIGQCFIVLDLMAQEQTNE